nr:TetR/AcrR family transcriptional regulator [Candidatus Protofrankia californiensis]
MPKLWNETIDAHRRAVREATLDAAAALVAARGLASVTMSQIAEETGIGRATLYKYFSDVDSIMAAWHERQVARHLEHLAAVGGRAGDIGARLEAVFWAYGLICHEHHGGELAALLHRGDHVVRAQEQLSEFVRGMLAEGVETGYVRDDVPPGELAGYCLHALTAASGLPSHDAVHRLVAVTLAGLRPRAEKPGTLGHDSAPPHAPTAPPGSPSRPSPRRSLTPTPPSGTGPDAG